MFVSTAISRKMGLALIPNKPFESKHIQRFPARSNEIDTVARKEPRMPGLFPGGSYLFQRFCFDSPK